MSDFQMNPADVQEASVLMSRLADRMSDLELTKSDDSFDCGDTAVQEALAYFVSMYNKRGQNDANMAQWMLRQPTCHRTSIRRHRR